MGLGSDLSVGGFDLVTTVYAPVCQPVNTKKRVLRHIMWVWLMFDRGVSRCLDISQCGWFGRIGCMVGFGVLYARVCARVRRQGGVR